MIPFLKSQKSKKPSFYAPLKISLALQKGVGQATFTRATAATVEDFEGLIKTVKSGEARFKGARRVENLILSTIGGSGWTTFSGTIPTITTGQPDPLGGNLAVLLSDINSTTNWGYVQSVSTNGRAYRSSIWLKGTTSGQVQIYQYDSVNGLLSTTVNITTSWQRFSSLVFTKDGINHRSLAIYSPTVASIYAYGAQTEDITNQSNQNPSEYVSNGVLSAPLYHGAGVDGVKYFDTYNGNTVTSNIVTESTGAKIPESQLKEILIETASTNLLLNSATLATQNVTTTAQQYTLSFYGTGSV